MGKRLRLVSTYSNHKRCRHNTNKFLEDRISQLPDEVLVSILSLLTIKEAAKTCVLSHRWERLWTSFTGSLNFDADPAMYYVKKELLKQNTSEFVSWVNQVLASLDRSSILDEFSVCCRLGKNSSHHIDRWIEFAMQKRVQRLKLNFIYTPRSRPYTLPLESYASLNLTSLQLWNINVSDKHIECFLSSCPLLEELQVLNSVLLLNLKVTGPTLKLKYLEISQCSCLESVEISAPNLVSLTVIDTPQSQRLRLLVANVPHLVYVSVDGDVKTYMSHSLSSYLSQLETLKLDIDFEIYKSFKPSVELSKLKHLVLSVYVNSRQSIFGWTSLIEACPNLHKFTLELMSDPDWGRKIQIGEVSNCPNQCLKVVEIDGFVGYVADVELVMYFANASALELIIIDLEWQNGGKTKKVAKKRALKLKKKLPPGVDFVIS